LKLNSPARGKFKYTKEVGFRYPIPKGLNVNSPVCNAGKGMRKKTTTEWLNIIRVMNPAKAGFFIVLNWCG